MEEKIIREKNRTSMKKITNDDDRLKEQNKLEQAEPELWRVWRLWSSSVRAGLRLLGEDD